MERINIIIIFKTLIANLMSAKEASTIEPKLLLIGWERDFGMGRRTGQGMMTIERWNSF